MKRWWCAPSPPRRSRLSRRSGMRPTPPSPISPPTVRAPTPTAAAELAMPVRAELAALVAGLADRAGRCARRTRERGQERLDALLRHWPAREALLAPQRQKLDELGERLPRALRGRLDAARGEAERVSRGVAAGNAEGERGTRGGAAARALADGRAGASRPPPAQRLCAGRGSIGQNPDLGRQCSRRQARPPDLSRRQGRRACDWSMAELPARAATVDQPKLL